MASYYSRARASERSAARLAHQSGGLGVASSNLAAPTNKIRHFLNFTDPFAPQKVALAANGDQPKERVFPNDCAAMRLT
jgi:hypothetical protein